MALQEYVATGVAEETLDGLLRGQGRRWFYGERIDAIELAWLADVLEDGVPWEAWEHGRAFDEAEELAWWREAGTTFTLRLLTTREVPDGVTWQDGNTWHATTGEPQAILLHGTLDDEEVTAPAWSEARIPRPLHYPLPERTAPKRVVLLAQPMHCGDELVALTRLLGVQGMS